MGRKENNIKRLVGLLRERGHNWNGLKSDQSVCISYEAWELWSFCDDDVACIQFLYSCVSQSVGFLSKDERITRHFGTFATKMSSTSFSTCACLSVCLSVRQSVRPSVRPSVCLFVRPSVCLSVRPSVCLSVCLSTTNNHRSALRIFVIFRYWKVWLKMKMKYNFL
jgi:hypothetical protein